MFQRQRSPNQEYKYLFTNAVSLIAAHTSRNDTSFVSVYPCRTLGSAWLTVEVDIHGVGIFSDSCCAVEQGLGAFSDGGSALYLRGDNERGICGLNVCFFFLGVAECSSVSEEEGDLASPSQTSISMQRHPWSRTWKNH